MDLHTLNAAIDAIGIIGDPTRLMYLVSGVLMGLVLGIIPGLGGLVGLSILLPFTYGMDAYAALAMMLGLSAVTVTSDTIPAVLFSVPGTVGSAATILDGFPMARKGEAGRALGAAFSASVIGGVFGALVLGLSVPVLRPLVLLIGSPELLAICIFGLSLVAALSGRAPLAGMAGVCLGLMVSTTGEDPQTATLRWTFDTLYLWEGMPIVPFALGLFALPEIADLVIARRAISGNADIGSRWAQLDGVRDVLRHYFLVLRCASIGSVLGAIPGMGLAVIDWIAYGHAARTEKGALETFGTGDVRGVIASESSNNAKEGGALIPTIAFGVPGSVSMALLLGAFLIQDIVPGPDLLTKRLDVTYTLVWSIAVANIFGAGICFAFANQLAKIALIRIGVLAPLILAVVYVGVFRTSSSWGDLYATLLFGTIGWTMKRMDWPRPPVILGFVLGGLIERYMFISIERYGFSWLGFPIVVLLLAMTLFGLARPAIAGYLAARRRPQRRATLRWHARPSGSPARLVFTLLVAAFFVVTIAVSSQWMRDAKLMPQVVGWAGLLFTALHFLGNFVTVGEEAEPRRPAAQGEGGAGAATVETLPTATMLGRAAAFLGWCLFYLGMIAVIGMLPALLVFLVLYMRFQGGERWRTAFAIALAAEAFCYILFHSVIGVVWPQSLLGDLFPALRSTEAFNIV